MKVCDKTCIFCFFPIINKYLCMTKRSLLSERPSKNKASEFNFVSKLDKSGAKPSVQQCLAVGEIAVFTL